MNKFLVLIPALFVTLAVFLNPPSVSTFLTGMCGLFIVVSVWIFSLGLIFDSK